MRVLTLNLLSREHADWPRRREVVLAGLRALDPDLVALQEVTLGEDHDGVAELLGDGYHVAVHPGSHVDGVGAALASRWPLRRVERRELGVSERMAGFPWAAVVAAETETPLGPLLFVHHKPTWQRGYEHERELQAVATARLVEELAAGRELHVVLAGDLDATPDSASVRFLTGRQSLHGSSVCYEDAWAALHPDDPGHTFSPANPLVQAGEMALERGRRIDYVMVRCGVHGPTLEATACERAFDAPVDGVWASDHFGVVADLELPRRSVGSWD